MPLEIDKERNTVTVTTTYLSYFAIARKDVVYPVRTKWTLLPLELRGGLMLT